MSASQYTSYGSFQFYFTSFFFHNYDCFGSELSQQKVVESIGVCFYVNMVGIPQKCKRSFVIVSNQSPVFVSNKVQIEFVSSFFAFFSDDFIPLRVSNWVKHLQIQQIKYKNYSHTNHKHCRTHKSLITHYSPFYSILSNFHTIPTKIKVFNPSGLARAVPSVHQIS